MSRKILITGPECSGKSTLARELARFYKASFIPEYARRYQNKIGRPYEEHDLLVIARRQIKEEQSAIASGQSIFFLDTSILSLRIWSEYKYAKCHPWILEKCKTEKYDVVLLCAPDLEWEYHPLREFPKFREQVFQIFKNYLKEMDQDYSVISGSGNRRLEKAVRVVQKKMM